MKHFSLVLLLLISCVVGCSVEGKKSVEDESIAGSIRPDVADVVRLSWVDGPPFVHAFLKEDEALKKYRDENAGLAIRSGRFGMVFDGRVPSISHFTLDATSDATEDILNYSQLKENWSGSALDLVAEIDGVIYRAVAGPIPEKQVYSPIRIIESGLWFHHVAVYGIELVDATGAKFPAKSRIELRAWSDQVQIEWFVEPEATDAQEGDLKVTFNSKVEGLSFSALQAFTESAEKRVELTFAVKDGVCVQQSPDREGIQISATPMEAFVKGETSVNYSEISQSWEVTLPKRDWTNPTGAAYPEQFLDRISNYTIKLENTSDEPRDLRLRFIHGWHPMTGFLPMLLDSSGQQTGLAVQTSKNWHVREKDRVPYDGEWVNASTRLTLKPNSSIDLQYSIVHAQWQGVPMASVGQLSLVGWGFNGFWTQMALGSWGESLCIQPGRTMRRAFVTDVRPFMVDSFIKRNRYDWPANLGGGDIAKIIDTDGNYIQWRGAVTDYKMSGPNLAHVSVKERSVDEKLRLQIDTFLPRTDSLNRSYFKVKLEALEAVTFERIALFQLGSDYYNDNVSDTIAWGNTAGLVGETKPAAGKWKNVIEPFALDGEDPWISVYGNHPDITHRDGVGVRGLIIRNFKAQIAQETFERPWLAVNRAKKLLGADIVLPPSVTRMSAGDVIEFELELIAFPIAAKYYYGPDDELKKRLSKNPNSWQLTRTEAVNNKLMLTEAGSTQIVDFPARIQFQGQGMKEITVKSASRRGTLLLEGLKSPTAWTVSEKLNDLELPLGERFSDEKSPQVTYDIASDSWTAVLSLRTCADSGVSIARNLSIRAH